MRFPKLTAVSIAIAMLAPLAHAQDVEIPDQATNKVGRASASHEKVVEMFPNATRREPHMGISSTDMSESIGKFLALVNAHKTDDEAIAMGLKIAGAHDANHYERAIAEEGIGDVYATKGDNAQAIVYFQKALAENALSNNDHYQLMLQMAHIQIAAGQSDDGLATLDRVVTETKLDKPEYNELRGRVYYGKKDYANAATALQKALDASSQPDPNAQQMLMDSYFRLKQPEHAEKVGQDIMKAHPGDKIAILNLAAVYQQANQSDKAAALLDDARKRGLLTTADDYRKLYALYSNMKGRENDSAAVINDGLQKGILQPGVEVYTVLAEDYFFTNQFPQAIDAYKKADALSSDGEAALNIAKIYNNQGKAAEAKAAAEHALQKGVKNPEDARGLIQRAGAVAGNKSAKKPPGKK